MKKWTLILSFVLIIVLSAACGVSETPTTEAPPPTEIPTTTPEPTLEPTNEPTVTEPEPVSIAEIMNINWMWTELIETEPTSQSIVADPENYTIIFWPDHSFNYQADCNIGSGTFSGDMSEFTMEMGPTTLVECEPQSLHDKYLLLLAGVTGYTIQDERLVLVVNEGAAQMVFDNGGLGEMPDYAPDSCADIQMSSVTIDTMDLPYSWQPYCIPTTPYDNSQPPGPMGMPEHVLLTFGVDDPNNMQTNDPRLYIIPVDDYIQQWEENGDITITTNIENLKKLLLEKPSPIPSSSMPVLPPVYAVNDLAVQSEYLDITMGNGVRFVGRFVQDPNPITNDGLSYVFQGFSGDGVYLISFFYPVTTSILPYIDDVSDEEHQQVIADLEAYLSAKVEELNAISSSEWEPDLATLDSLINSLEFEYEIPEPSTATRLTNIKWEWNESTETDPASQTTVPNPENYIMIFLPNGDLDILADCNFGIGAFTLDGNNITLDIEAITRMDCGDDSLSNQFITMLGDVTTYELTTEKLTLHLKENSGSMGFINGGLAIIIPAPGDDVPTATTFEPLNVRSGPGTVYQSYGTVPSGTTFEVTGISEDGAWWVVILPSEIASSGQGWISATYVETQNTENAPVVPTPPLDGDEVTPPEPSIPTATALEPINMRSGPGTDYPSYGVAPVGATGVVIGISEDGQWWVVELSTNIAPNGQGWVNAKYVEVTNAENVPVIPTPSLP